jgi:hypothetical protein
MTTYVSEVCTASIIREMSKPSAKGLLVIPYWSTQSTGLLYNQRSFRARLTHRPDYGGSTYLWNVGRHSVKNTAVHPRVLWAKLYSVDGCLKNEEINIIDKLCLSISKLNGIYKNVTDFITASNIILRLYSVYTSALKEIYINWELLMFQQSTANSDVFTQLIASARRVNNLIECSGV